MSKFVESCVEMVKEPAKLAERAQKGKPHARKLLKAVAGKTNIVVTCHMHPDPDALGSAAALAYLLKKRMPEAKVRMCVRGQIPGGLNDAFSRHARLDISPWPDSFDAVDAVILCDVQPTFPTNPLPETVHPIAVIDHHRSRRRNPDCEFCDIRPDIGATASIVFSYFAELDEVIPPDLSAVLLYAIESDLAGSAGTPSELDNLALSTLALTADTRRLYKMRNVSLPQEYFAGYAAAMTNAVRYGTCLLSAVGPVQTLEKPAVMADFLLRLDGVETVLVTGLHDEDGNGVADRLVLSLRTGGGRSAGELMRKIVRDLGQGGGHRHKAGGFVPLDELSDLPAIRAKLKRRLLRSLEIGDARGQWLLPQTPPKIDVTGGTANARSAPAMDLDDAV